MSRDPEERCGPDTGGSEPEPVLDDFEQIVAGWRSEGQVPEWPADLDPPAATAPVPDPAPESPAAPPPVERDESRFENWEAQFAATPPAVEQDPPTQPGRVVRPAVPDQDEHFVPPEPPPLPRLGPPAAVGLVLLALGLVLVVAPGVLGMSSVYGLPLGLLSLAAGLGWLVLRLWPSSAEPDFDDDDDDGAVL
jgi:hypothetical protein